MTDYNYLDEFCQNIKTLGNDIDTFVRKVKEQQQRKTTRKYRSKQAEQSDSDRTEESISLGNQNRDDEPERAIWSDTLPTTTRTSASLASSSISIIDDDEFENICSAEQIMDMMIDDSNGAEVDPFAIGDESPEEIDPFSIADERIIAENYDTTAIVLPTAEEQDEN